jgi:hypothetical protein
LRQNGRGKRSEPVEKIYKKRKEKGGKIILTLGHQ